MVAFIATQTPLRTSGRNRLQAPEYLGLILSGALASGKTQWPEAEIRWG
jgi:hypothetical protein